MRLFLAIDLPPKVKDQLEEQILTLKKDYASFNWVTKENFHLTLLFFGEIEDTNKLDKIKKKIEEAIYDAVTFRLYSLGAGLFLKNKVVLHIDFRREKKLEELVDKIKISLQLNDYKKYLAHLTIARTRVPSKQQYLLLKKKLEKLSVDISFPVEKIHLFQTIVQGQKPIYKKIVSFSLLKQIRS